MFIRWTEVIFMIRNIFALSSNWTGVAGPEFLALGLGYFSRFGGAVFIIVTGITGGVDLAQMASTLLALGAWEWLSRKTRVGEKRKREDEGFVESLKNKPEAMALIVLIIFSWLSFQLKVIF